MSDFSVGTHNSETHGLAAERSAERRLRALRRAHESRIRFHLLLNLGFALGALWVLKVDGPYYADGISAALLLCGAFVSLWSKSEIRKGETEADVSPSRFLTLLFSALPLFFAGAAVAVIYFTYIVPPEMPFYDEEGLTRTRFAGPLLHWKFA